MGFQHLGSFLGVCDLLHEGLARWIYAGRLLGEECAATYDGLRFECLNSSRNIVVLAARREFKYKPRHLLR